MTETPVTNPFDIHKTIQVAKYPPVNTMISKFIGQVSGLNMLSQIYQSDQRLSQLTEPDSFIRQALEILNINYQINSGSLTAITDQGGLVIVANHPFGGIDGLILGLLLKQVRNDVKILANGFLKRIPALESLIIDVDPINKKASMQKNAMSLKKAVRYVKDGGCLIIFPAGEVSHLKLSEQRIVDSEWSITVAKLVKLSKSPVLPFYFHGNNSLNFQLWGLIHPLIRTLLLPRELLKKVNSDIQLDIGQLIKFNKLKTLEHDKLIQFLRFSTYALGGKDNLPQQKNSHKDSSYTNIIDPVPTELMHEEIKHLPENQTLITSRKAKVIYAYSKQIPWIVQEIGRLREITFREIGEGTGKETDIDIYDSYYIHLFMWDIEKQCIVGAYRLGLTDEIINNYGIKGLYSYSLFKYSKKKIIALGPSIELGRSFIRSEYQRSPSALSLLWKGIGCFIARKACYTTLFGPVSISNDYKDISRKLIVDCLSTNQLMKEVSRNIKPRKPYKTKNKVPWKKNELNALQDINLVSEIISQLEQGKRGIPVLIKQYTKLGGRFLEFNVDEEFNNALDGLIVVDLRNTEVELLEYFMGKDETHQYLDDIKPNMPKLKYAS